MSVAYGEVATHVIRECVGMWCKVTACIFYIHRYRAVASKRHLKECSWCTRVTVHFALGAEVRMPEENITGRRPVARNTSYLDAPTGHFERRYVCRWGLIAQCFYVITMHLKKNMSCFRQMKIYPFLTHQLNTAALCLENTK